MSQAAEEVKQAIRDITAGDHTAYDPVDGTVFQSLLLAEKVTPCFEGELLFLPPRLAGQRRVAAETMIVRHVAVVRLDRTISSSLNNAWMRFRCNGHELLMAPAAMTGHLKRPVVVQPHDNHSLTVEYITDDAPALTGVIVSIRGTWFIKREAVGG